MTNTSRGSAQIYQFPARGRFAQAEAAPVGASGTLPEDSFAPSFAKIVFGSSWYHDEAIAEERSRGA